jgi:hypothetical protein
LIRTILNDQQWERMHPNCQARMVIRASPQPTIALFVEAVFAVGAEGHLGSRFQVFTE